ncbi:unnamed protein product [Nyctereutes procyonoides]|uniref:(raccoon dog) hypothetical protein n=1 Tax=Nyctereutes procyonoides TaxID=34880 RepID=A0A811ZZ98_NYCPR|nr:unnamed protein product [Nyctereutes procyonoides]
MQTLLVRPVSPNVDFDPYRRGELREKWGEQVGTQDCSALAVLLPRPPTACAALGLGAGRLGGASRSAALPNPCSSAGGGFGGAPGLTAAKASGETGSPGSPSSKGPPRKSRKGGGGDPADACMRSLSAQPAGAPTPELTGLQGAEQQQEHSGTGKKRPERQTLGHQPPRPCPEVPACRHACPLSVPVGATTPACGDDSHHPQPLTRSWSSLLNHKAAVKAEDPRCVGGCGTQRWAAAGLGESPRPQCWSPRVPSRPSSAGPASKHTHARPQVSHERPRPHPHPHPRGCHPLQVGAPDACLPGADGPRIPLCHPVSGCPIGPPPDPAPAAPPPRNRTLTTSATWWGRDLEFRERSERGEPPEAGAVGAPGTPGPGARGSSERGGPGSRSAGVLGARWPRVPERGGPRSAGVLGAR